MLKIALIVIALCLVFIMWLELSMKAARYLSTNHKLENIVKPAVLVLVVLLTIFWSTGLIGLWRNGISYIANNTKEYTDSKGHFVEGNYSILIDLSNLESNVGKDLYNDGTHRIYVSDVVNSGSINTGGYIIGFRASGPYSLTNATLISGVHHATINSNSFSMNMTANMTSEYKGKIYNSSVRGQSGLNYKDGDHFSFYVFPAEAYDNKEVSLNEKGVVHLTVTNLYKNIWSKV